MVFDKVKELLASQLEMDAEKNHRGYGDHQ